MIRDQIVLGTILYWLFAKNSLGKNIHQYILVGRKYLETWFFENYGEGIKKASSRVQVINSL
jgi:hypothetical protein